jgi:hypothetical protein
MPEEKLSAIEFFTQEVINGFNKSYKKDIDDFIAKYKTKEHTEFEKDVLIYSLYKMLNNKYFPVRFDPASLEERWNEIQLIQEDIKTTTL